MDAAARAAGQLLLDGQVDASCIALDALASTASTPAELGSLWLRGIALYFAGRFEEAAAQFTADMLDASAAAEQPLDTEEAIWQAVCKSHCPGSPPVTSRGAPAIPDKRACMAELADLIVAGTGSVGNVLAAVDAVPSGTAVAVGTEYGTEGVPGGWFVPRACAFFYLGLWADARGGAADEGVSAAYFQKAKAEVEAARVGPASSSFKDDFMCLLICARAGGALAGIAHPPAAAAAPAAAGAAACVPAATPSSIVVPRVPYVQAGDGSATSSSYSRVLNGGWQLSEGHSSRAAAGRAAQCMARAVTEFGITTFDCGDIYTGVEEAIGTFLQAERKRHGRRRVAEEVEIHTKFVPDLDAILQGAVDDSMVKAMVHRSCARLGGAVRLDLVQFHWWDFSVPGYVRAGEHLVACQAAGLVAQLGLCNFDTEHALEMVSSGFPAVTNQVQYSVLDRRVESDGMVARLCEPHGVALIAYGVLAGGFLSQRWLGAPEPAGDPKSLENRSLTKYKLIIDDAGGWEWFQRVLTALDAVACRHTTIAGGSPVTLSQVAIAWVLSRPGVGGVICGVRDERHLPATAVAGAPAGVVLDEEDIVVIEEAYGSTADCAGLTGPVYGLERSRKGKHGAIMRYNLNRLGSRFHAEEVVRRVTERLEQDAAAQDDATESNAQVLWCRHVLEETRYILQQRPSWPAAPAATAPGAVIMCDDDLVAEVEAARSAVEGMMAALQV